MISIRQIPTPSPGRGTTEKTQKFYFGGLAPKFDPRPHHHRNLSRARWGAHGPEKISEIARTVAEKIEFEKKNLWRPLAAKPEALEVT